MRIRNHGLVWGSGSLCCSMENSNSCREYAKCLHNPRSTDICNWLTGWQSTEKPAALCCCWTTWGVLELIFDISGDKPASEQAADVHHCIDVYFKSLIKRSREVKGEYIWSKDAGGLLPDPLSQILQTMSGEDKQWVYSFALLSCLQTALHRAHSLYFSLHLVQNISSTLVLAHSLATHPIHDPILCLKRSASCTAFFT